MMEWARAVLTNCFLQGLQWVSCVGQEAHGSLQPHTCPRATVHLTLSEILGEVHMHVLIPHLIPMGFKMLGLSQ